MNMTITSERIKNRADMEAAYREANWDAAMEYRAKWQKCRKELAAKDALLRECFRLFQSTISWGMGEGWHQTVGSMVKELQTHLQEGTEK